ncbi:MAG TPA: flagellar export chaperone FliS [Bryobacteraceae bacterium]|nr:flagellar export chaperone FliS [Bryobacteraceae bacterium]
MESEIHSADPVKLIAILYRAAVEAVGAARSHLAAGNIELRTKAVNKVIAILTELTTCLDREKGGDIANHLGELYDYIGRRVLEANCRQIDAPLAEVESLLVTLLDAWQNCSPCYAEVPPSGYAPLVCSY